MAIAVLRDVDRKSMKAVFAIFVTALTEFRLNSLAYGVQPQCHI